MLPLTLLKTAINHPMLIELKNGETYNGHLANCDAWMNIYLVQVICTSRDGDRFWKMPECYIRGSTIKYLRLSDEVIENYKEDSSNRGGQNMNRRDNQNRGGRSGGQNQRGGGGGGRNNSNNRGGFNQNNNRRNNNNNNNNNNSQSSSNNIAGSNQNLSGRPAKQQRRQ